MLHKHIDNQLQNEEKESENNNIDVMHSIKSDK